MMTANKRERERETEDVIEDVTRGTLLTVPFTHTSTGDTQDPPHTQPLQSHQREHANNTLNRKEEA